MGFSQSLSGVNAASSQLDTIGNNIANSQTVGFKSSTTQFADIYANSQGLGTRVAATVQNFTTGSLETTGRALDLAIAGDGFFQFSQNEQMAYSRNGQLTMSADGYFENAQGARLTNQQGEPLQITQFSQGAQATTDVQSGFNLDAEAETLTPLPAGGFNPNNSDTYNYVTNAGTVYDALGVGHDLSLYYTKTADNTWSANAVMEGQVVGTTTGMTFDSGSGDLTANGVINATASTAALGTGAAPMNFNINLEDSTQYGQEFELRSFTQDGNTAGTFVGVEITENGEIMANYSNGNSGEVGTIGMANFRNPEGLTPEGDNLWTATEASGAALVGQAGTGQLGSLESGTVEASNVDLTQELVDMIIAQRNFQANTNAIQTQSDVMKEVNNLR
ncbi:flagellar hook protein FlgE [Chromohalobacter marismortui]|uniref:Flagellar hook protein FlgE n=1 Tax=Chromohalobacter marismortui TaxID=42055 RepID=A0A4R7NPG5_9GAMM|nr:MULTISPECIES: flagellar hook protein FlgE [Chromohalobacter]MCI0508842.1 flagellar hook protein FlgE [Chromohalobacter sp.]MCI0594301.1 flagellar hook protein FlgE [Chromohalobacter sp.]TDU22784.1 flagellar hook protein FlgE [Chromohalobacter marismortui]